MKVYTRVSGKLKGRLFREGQGFFAENLIDGKWINGWGWSNQNLKETQFFRLVGNNFRLK